MKRYDHKKIETKWQKKWEEAKLYETKESEKPKCYVLDMFPYPSGEGLHVGHPKGYIATDVYSRFKRMQDREILHPMGWDAFGLPAENFAIKNKIHPRKAVEQNIARFKEQLAKIGLNYDWSREINTTDPDYYKWTQWIFLKMFEKGLAYESNEPINWCPSCKTGLANEDLEQGRCERCGSMVERRPMRQWMLRITDYADRLLNDLETLTEWPEHIKEMQRQWIGRSEGAEIEFGIMNHESRIKVFTTRPDTLFGATYLVLSPEHSWMEQEIRNPKSEIRNKSKIQKYINNARKKTEVERTADGKEKTGVELEGIKAVNPASGEEIPVWVADYVLANVGTGAIMAVPAHDERDFAFAKQFGLPIREVVVPNRIDAHNPPVEGKEKVPRNVVQAYVRNPRTGKVLVLKWKKHPWTAFPMGGIDERESPIEAARREVREETGYANLSEGVVCGGQVRAEFFAAHKDENRIAFTHLVCFDLIDETREEIAEEEQEIHDVVWLNPSEVTLDSMVHAEMDVWINRLKDPREQPYIGDGVLINSDEFNGLSVEEAKLAIIKRVGGKSTTTYKLRDWVFSRQRYWGEPIPLVHCEQCGVVPVSEEELPVMLPEVTHYEPTGTGESPLAKIEEWVNTTCPKCGGVGKRETNTMPQWAGSSWYYLAYVMRGISNFEFPISKYAKTFKKWLPVDLYVGGAEHATRHLIYARFWHKFLFDIGVVPTEEPFLRLQSVGLILAEDGRKMSKRFGNVVNPDDIVARFGADTLRVYEMFMGPFSDAIAWSTDNMVGSRRFLEKVWRLKENICNNTVTHEKFEQLVHKTIKKVNEDIEQTKFNTAISALMILANAFEKEGGVSSEQYAVFLILLSPFAPHITEELWHTIGKKTSIHTETWPPYNPAVLKQDRCVVAIQINGKVRGTVEVQKDATEDEVTEAAKALDTIQKWSKNKEIKKTFYVPGKVLNIVI